MIMVHKGKIKLSKKYFDILFVYSEKGKTVLAGKVVEGSSAQAIMRAPKSKYVGEGREIVGVVPTAITNVRKWKSLPRNKRFSDKYFPYSP